MKSWKKIVATVALAMVASGCGDGLLAEGEEIVYLSPRGASQVSATTVEDQWPEHEEQREANYQQIRQGFSARPGALLRDPEAPSMLSAIEQSFLLSGHYLELIELYEEVFEAEGTDSVAAPALAWAYMQIGHQPAVRALVERMVEERPEDPLTWLVAGNAHLSMGDLSLASQQRALDSFEKVLELDPGFERFIAMDRGRLEAQISSLRQQIPEDFSAEAMAEADEAAPMHHAGGESGQALEAAPEDGVEEGEAQAREAREEEESREAADEAAKEVAREMAQEEAPAIAAAIEGALETEEEEESEEVDEEEVDPLQAARKVAEGRRLMGQGSAHYTAAQQAFEEALEHEPENVDAAIGILQLAQRSEAPREMLVEQVETIGEHELTAQQAYDLGLFSLHRLNEPDLATSLLERVRDKDPTFAKRVDIDALLDE